MKYVKEFGIIIVISFIGELLSKAVPLPVPASIYGLVLLFLCLCFKIVPLRAIEKTGKIFIDIMPLMFIAPAVGLIDMYGVVERVWLPYVVITIVSTVVVMVVAGKVTEFVIKRDVNS